MSYVFAGFLSVASALIAEAQKQSDLLAAEAFYRRAISTSYYALYHRLTEDSACLLFGRLEEHRQTAFRRSIGHRDFKGLRKDLVDQRQQADRACLPERKQVLEGLLVLCADLIQLQESRELADYAPAIADPRTTAEESLLSAQVGLQNWETMPESAQRLLAQSLLWHLKFSQLGR